MALVVYYALQHVLRLNRSREGDGNYSHGPCNFMDMKNKLLNLLEEPYVLQCLASDLRRS